MGSEPGALGFDEFRGVLAEIVDGIEGQFAGDVVGLVVGRGFDVGGPAIGGLEKLGERFADVVVAAAVFVEVVFELVDDGSELFEEVVGVLLAARAARGGEEIMDSIGALVEEPGEDENTVARNVSGFAELLDLCFRESVVVVLGVKRPNVKRCGERENGEGEAESSKHSGLVVEDLVEELVLDQIKLFECGLDV